MNSETGRMLNKTDAIRFTVTVVCRDDEILRALRLSVSSLLIEKERKIDLTLIKLLEVDCG